MPEHEQNTQNVQIRSMFGYRSQKPLVLMIINEHMTQMSPAKAREIAGMLLECAESAEQAGFIVRFGVERIGLQVEQAARILEDFRAMRDRWQEEEEQDGG